MSKLTDKIKYYSFAGVTKEEYKEVKDYVNASNMNIFKYLSAYGIVFMLIMLIASFIPQLKVAEYRLLYIIFLLFFTLCRCSRFILKKHLFKYASAAQYCLLIGVSVFATINSTVIAKNYAALIACVFLFAIPVFVTDVPYRIALLSLFNLTFFIVLAIIFKSQPSTSSDTMTLDILNSIVFTILGILTGGFIQLSRFSEIKQSIKIQAQNATLEKHAKSEHENYLEAQSKLDIDHISGALTQEAFIKKATEFVQEKPSGYFVLVCLDIQGFKRLNEIYGYENGDRILRHVVDSAKQLNTQDVLGCRSRADTFYMMYKYIPEKEKEIYKDFDINIQKHGFDFDIHYRRGAYIIDDKSISIIQSMDRALLAMESIEKGVENEIVFYSKEMHETLSKQQELTDYAVTALKEEQFKVYYQPKIDFNTGTLYGAEALVRWDHPKYGIIMPNEFIPLFEKDGFIWNINKYVFEESCKLIKSFTEHGITPFPISINMSRSDVNYENTIPTIKEIINKYNIDPLYIHLEITERAYNENPDDLLKMVNEITKMGITLELDDYGNGVSSEKTLIDLPISVIKLDKNLVSGSEYNQKNSIIISSIISIADLMGLEIIAEGIETTEMAERLMSFGCHYMQGFLFSKPIPTEDFISLIITKRNSFEKTKNHQSSLIKNNQIIKSVIDGSFRKLIENSDDYIYIIDNETGKTIFANNKFRSLPNYYENGICSKILSCHSEACENCPADIAEISGHSETAEIKLPNGKIFITTAMPIESTNGKLMFISARDVTDLYNDRERLKNITKKSEMLEKELSDTKRFNQILNAFAEISHSTYLINIEDDTFTVLKDYDLLSKIVNAERPYTEQINNWLNSEYFPPESANMMRPIVSDLKELKKHFIVIDHDEFEFVGINNRWVRVFLVVVSRNRNGDVKELLWLSQDIDSEKRTVLESVEEKVKLEYETKHDYLTGMLTRQAFRELAPTVLSDDNKKFAIAFITLTRFYNVNKDKGYLFCDEYLKTFAERIRKANPDGINARIRGGTFAVMYEYSDTAEDISKNIFKNIQGKYKGVPLTFSMGVSTTECCGRGYEGLCITADAAAKLNVDNGADSIIIADDEFVNGLIEQKGTEGEQI